MPRSAGLCIPSMTAWRCWRTAITASILQRYYTKEFAENMMLHVTVADARACAEQIKEQLAASRFPGVRVSQPKQEPYGALVTYVWDPAGVLLHLAQWIDR